MKLFGGRRDRVMAGYAPLEGSWSLDGIIEKLAQDSFDAPVHARNSFANAALAWVEENLGVDGFDKFRKALFDLELAINAKDWESRFPDETAELGILKQMVLLVEMAKAMGGRRVNGDNYFKFYGPDIPSIVSSAYQKLVASKQG